MPGRVKIRMKSGVIKAREYWRHMMHSSRKKMSQGAQKLNTIISWARGDSWRRKEKKKEKKG